jgi:hypothetical protein
MRLVLSAIGIVLVAVLVADKLRSRSRAQSPAKQYEELHEIKVGNELVLSSGLASVDTSTMITYPQWILFGDSVGRDAKRTHLKADKAEADYATILLRWRPRTAPI